MRPQGARALRGRVPCVGAEEVCSEPPLCRARAALRPRIEYENAAAPSREPGECGGISFFTVEVRLIFQALSVR